VNGRKSPLSVFNMIYSSALSIFIFEISPPKVVVIWFISASQTFKIPIKYDFFLPNTKFFYRFDRKVGRKLSKFMWLKCFKILTHRNFSICIYGWEGWWKCLKMLWYFKISEDYKDLYHFWDTQANHDPFVDAKWNVLCMISYKRVKICAKILFTSCYQRSWHPLNFSNLDLFCASYVIEEKLLT